MACNLIPQNYAFAGQPIFRLNNEVDLLTLYNNAISEPYEALQNNVAHINNEASVKTQIYELTELVVNLQTRLNVFEENNKKANEIALKCNKLQNDLYMTVLPNLSSLNYQSKSGKSVNFETTAQPAPVSLQPEHINISKSYAEVAASSGTDGNNKKQLNVEQRNVSPKINKNNVSQVKTPSKVYQTTVPCDQEVKKQYNNKIAAKHSNKGTVPMILDSTTPTYTTNKFDVLSKEHHHPAVQIASSPERTSDYKLSYCTGDLMEQKMNIAINVSEDLYMSSGIALTVKNILGPEIMHDLKKQKLKIGDTGVIFKAGHHILIVVTKKKYYHKPNKFTSQEFKHNFISGLQSLKTQCENYNITHLAIPRMGCGEDRLEWKFVSQQMYNIFKHSNTKITVYTLPQDIDKFSTTNQMHSPLKGTNTPVKVVNSHTGSSKTTVKSLKTVATNTSINHSTPKPHNSPQNISQGTSQSTKTDINILLQENEEETQFALDYLKAIKKDSDYINAIYKSELALVEKKITDFEELQLKRNLVNRDFEQTKQSLALLREKNLELKANLKSKVVDFSVNNIANSNTDSLTQENRPDSSIEYSSDSDTSDSTSDSDTADIDADTTFDKTTISDNGKSTDLNMQLNYKSRQYKDNQQDINPTTRSKTKTTDSNQDF